MDAAYLSEVVIERLLVTGGAGFIGSHFALSVQDRYRVTVLDKLTYAGRPGNLRGYTGRFVEGDICDSLLVESLSAEVDAIVNFAAETHVDRSLNGARAFVESNTLGVAVLCEAAVHHKHRLFVQVSTDEVYGHVASGYSVESDPMQPRNPYAASKTGGEHLARSYSTSFGLPVLVTRGSNTYGPRQYPEKLIPVLIERARAGEPLPLYGDGSAVRDYLHVSDHCAAIRLLLNEGVTGTFNIGANNPLSGNEVAAAVLEATGSTSQIEYVPDRPGHDYRYAMDASKLRCFGWQPRIDFNHGLRELVG